MLRKLSPVLLSLLLLAGCSSTFMYNQLDWVIPWYVDDYVDLSRSQERSLKQQLQPLLQWHRGEELASYLEILELIERDLEQEIGAETVRRWGEQILLAWERVQERALPVALTIGEELSDQQIADFMAVLNEKQLELEREYLPRSDADYIEDSYENFEENFDDFLGPLSAEQEQVLRDSTRLLVRYDQEWLAERRAWLSELEVLLAREPGWQAAVRGAIARREAEREQGQGEDYRNQNLINDTIARVLNLRTEKQSRRMQRELDGYRSDLQRLIGVSAS